MSLVKCELCGLLIESTEALEHMRITGHNSWTMYKERKRRNGNGK